MVVEVGLAARRVEQVAGPHDFFHALLDVVDDNGEVVRRSAVAALEHKVVNCADHVSHLGVDERADIDLGAQSQRRRSALRLPLLSLGGREVSACPGVNADGCVRRRRGFANLTTRAPAAIGAARGTEVLDDGAVDVYAVGLSHLVAIEVDAERGEIPSLGGLVLRRGSHVEIVPAKKERTSALPGAEPCQHRRPQVADVERPRWARGISADCHPRIVPRDGVRCGRWGLVTIGIGR